MKGMVFTEFLEMVENIYGFTTADRIISESALGSNGIYTAMATYPHGEMVTIVSKLSDITGESISSLFFNFGKHLFSRFHDMHPSFFSDNLNSLDFPEAIENYIHPEVIKLYPDAELPGFVASRKSENVLEMEYTSKMRMHDFA